ncbi:predicted protein [Nematostella vectensis]|uniref:Kinesin-like protein n=1 Tax=Nematostella vectensis TaxID=45351 RepID=A7RVQ1_NEMVE|nr:kinesin-like protein KIF9 [Nematostella vectensis]EDO44491.1 predicted protein [Nematostella vectensis]|eukprot:XP_001636554.1 predicted protein [Nematostella vectensis]
MSASGKVEAVVRIRPTARFAQDMIDLQQDGKSMTIHCSKDTRRGYINNQVLDWNFQLNKVLHNASQETVYEECARKLVTSTLDGYNGTVMAYGQTGSGKTFTMTGSTEKFEHRGIIPRSIQQLFREIADRPNSSVTVRISYLEIYNEGMYDLLSTLPGVLPVDPSTMTVSEDVTGLTHVKGLSVHTAINEEEALNLLFEGETNRIIAQHSLNKRSSRSHCIFTLYVETHSRVESNTKYTLSKLNLVDLAGSERLGKTESQGSTQTEAMYINKSLTFLEQAVIALGDNHRDHVPYRQSKLTHVLKDSIGGRCKMMLIANIWGEASQIEETLSTLRFASRMMNVPCEPAIMEHFDYMKLCQEYQKEIKNLRKELAMHDTLTNRSQISYEPLSESQIEDVKDQVKRFLSGDLDDIELVNMRQIKETFAQFRKIVNSMEEEVEERVKQNLEQERSVASAAGGKPGTAMAGEGGLVGDVDGNGFGVGVAGTGVRPNVSALVGSKRSKSRKSRDRDSTGKKSPAAPGDNGLDGDKASSPTSEGSGNRPTTPPPKNEAFEDFKKERGSEINRILNENKQILREKKRSAKELSSRVNSIKSEIDQEAAILESKQDERLEQGDYITQNGQRFIDEDEYEHLKKLKELKASYRESYEELKSTKSDVTYCEKLVDQCRQRLLTEFDSWYTESFLGPDEQTDSSVPGVRKVSRDGHVPEDEQEKFDRLQLELLMENPDSVPYYNAKMQTERRMHLTASGRQRRLKPGAIVATVRNKPPTTLIIT